MISESSVVVMDSKVSRTDFTDSQLLLLIRRGRHRVPIVHLCMSLFLLYLLNIFHHLNGFLYISFSSQLLCSCQLLSNLLCEFMNPIQFGRHFGCQFFLGFSQTFLCQVCLSIGFIHEGLQMIECLFQRANQLHVNSRDQKLSVNCVTSCLK